MNDQDSDPLRENSAVPIDRTTLLELLSLCNRTLDTFGLIAPMLKLAREEHELDHLCNLSVAEVLSLEGNEALEKFGDRCMILCLGRADQHQVAPDSPAKLRQAALQNPVPETRLQWRGNQSIRRPLTQ